MSFWLRSLVLLLLKNSGIFYLSPSNFNYWWNFGVIASFFLMSQIVSGIVLAMFYNPNSLLAYYTMMDINNEIYYGWWISAVHANGASFFFLSVFIHIFRGLYYGSFLFPSQYLWMSGIILWLLMTGTAFFGYILPWGQMSFWGAMVITSLLGAIPGMGNDIVLLLWGGYSIQDATLHSFYSLHFTFPFILLIVFFLHIGFLHEFGSNNPLGIVSILDWMPFSPYYTMKDSYSLVMVFIFFCSIIYVSPDLLGHPDNYNMANFLVTPPHIVPEWYFLLLYAILSSVSGKLLGIVLLFSLFVSLFFLPFIVKNFIVRSSTFKPIYGFFVWSFICVCLVLGWLGGLPVIEPFYSMGSKLTFFYYFIILFLFPICGFVEKVIYDYYALSI